MCLLWCHRTIIKVHSPYTTLKMECGTNQLTLMLLTIQMVGHLLPSLESSIGRFTIKTVHIMDITTRIITTKVSWLRLLSNLIIKVVVIPFINPKSLIGTLMLLIKFHTPISTMISTHSPNTCTTEMAMLRTMSGISHMGTFKTTGSKMATTLPDSQLCTSGR